MVAYILLGLFAVTAAAGGMKNMFKDFGINGIVAAILISLTALLQAVPPIKITEGVYISPGGALLIVYAIIAIFYRSRIGAQLYVFYISTLLGLLFFATEKWLIGIEIGAPTAANVLLYAALILTIMLFSPNPRIAFSVSVLSVNVAALLFYITLKTPYIIGGGDTYFIAVIAFIAGAVLSYYVKNTVQKLYPKPKEMFAEAADEITPDDDDSDKN